MRDGTDLVIPVKTLEQAKSRLRGAADPIAHQTLVLALVRDTVAAASATIGVRRVLVITDDPIITETLVGDGIEVSADAPRKGLNYALAHGAALLLEADAGATVGALQADLPALRPTELASALQETAGKRAFCTDRQGTGTTLLVAAPLQPLDPQFGMNSATAHATSGARAITGDLPSLRCDVDTAEDLAAASTLGLGKYTAAVMEARGR